MLFSLPNLRVVARLALVAFCVLLYTGCGGGLNPRDKARITGVRLRFVTPPTLDKYVAPGAPGTTGVRFATPTSQRARQLSGRERAAFEQLIREAVAQEIAHTGVLPNRPNVEPNAELRFWDLHVGSSNLGQKRYGAFVEGFADLRIINEEGDYETVWEEGAGVESVSAHTADRHLADPRLYDASLREAVEKFVRTLAGAMR